MNEQFICTTSSEGVSKEMHNLSPAQFRLQVRNEDWNKPTAGCCSGHIQLNLVILPKTQANHFKEFCRLNPKPCPLIETTEPGQTEAKGLAPGSDLRTDIPGYKLFRRDKIDFLRNLTDLWRDDFVSFLIGCSFTFENALIQHGIPIRHIDLNCNVPMYITNIPCKSAGPFHGNMVVSMRPIPRQMVKKAEEITGHYPDVHGAPIHAGDPEKIGILDIEKPEFGDHIPIYPGEVPVFWACGVTPQVALMNASPEIAITHAPGLMFVSDARDEDFYKPL